MPLHVSLNRPFKAHVKRLYAKWTGHNRRPDIALFCERIVKAWKVIQGKVIRKSFKKCCVTNSMDGTEDDIAYDSDECSPSDSSSESSDNEFVA